MAGARSRWTTWGRALRASRDCCNRCRKRACVASLAATGLGTAAAGLAVLGQAGTTSAYATAVMPGLVLVGFGAGLSFVAITTAALARVDEAAAGLASGLLSTSVQIGLSLGLAMLVAVSTGRTSDLAASGATPVAAELGGIQLGLLVAAATAFAASITALVALRGDRLGLAQPA